MSEIFTAGPNSGFELFPVSGQAAGTETFSYSATDGDSLMGTVIWNQLEDHTDQPKFFGTLAISTVTGDPAFTSNFSGGTAEIDWTMNSIGSFFDVFVTLPAYTTVSATISSGEDVPLVPEPASLTVLGTALVGLGWLGRRRSKQVLKREDASEVASGGLSSREAAPAAGHVPSAGMLAFLSMTCTSCGGRHW